MKHCLECLIYYVKGCDATAAEIQDSFQSMTKHSTTGVQALNNFLFQPAGPRAWKAYCVGTSNFLLTQPKKHDTRTEIKELQPLSRPSQDIHTFHAVTIQAQDIGPSTPTGVQISQ